VSHASFRTLLGAALFVSAPYLLAAEPDFKAYRTVDTAVKAVPKPASGQVAQTGYLGVTVQRDSAGRLVVEDVQPESPAAKAGLKKGDFVLQIDGHAVTGPDVFRELLQTHGPDESVKLVLEREGKPIDVAATLSAASRPMKLSTARPPYLGIELGEAKEGEGVKLERVIPGSPAESSGLKSGDRIMKLEGADFTRPSKLDDLLSEKKPGDALTLTVRREGKDIDLKATLGERGRTGGRDGGRNFGPPPLWTKEVFRVAVIGIDFSDIKHNAKVPTREWEDALLSHGSYRGKMNATGQEVFGSLNDWLHEQSAWTFRIEGRVFEWVEVSKKRGDYSQGSGTANKTVPLVEALDKLAARDGKDALAGFDGFLFIYAGERVNTNPGGLYYPHAGQLTFQSKRMPYLIGPEGGPRMETISSFAKPFGQALGLPDLAARPENRGSEGLGPWCAMSDVLGKGRPQHMSAWAKEKLGWLKPTVIDPTVKQKLILAPVEDSSKECFKVLVRPDGSEYFLLENRKKKGFDTDLPGEGLLIWRVVNDRPVLEESHGVEGPSGPTVHLASVPYPSPSNSSFTPDTVPSSRSPLGGGLPVHITEIRRPPDGRIAFNIGYEYR
jgi:M6 family metalloprotease-like protein